MQLNPTLDKPLETRFIIPFISQFLVLVGAMLLAVQTRLQVPLGNLLSPSYQAQPVLMYVLLAGCAFITNVVSQSSVVSDTGLSRWLGSHHPFRRYMASLALAVIGVIVLFPDVSLLQVAYFGIAGVMLGILCIALPYRIYVGRHGNDLPKALALIVKRRALLSIWLRFNIESRYSQRILGILWIILLPIATSVVLAFAFTQFMRVQLDIPFITFYMSAMVPYTLFSSGMLNSTMSVVGRMGIITQVYFPREFLVLLTLGEAIIDFGFAFCAMMIINLFVGILPNIYFFYLPFLFLLLIVMILGLMFLISSLTVMVRDIPQLLSVLIQLLFFITPIIYPVSQYPAGMRFLFIVNPLAPIIQAIRDIIAFGHAPDLISLHFPIVFAGVALIVGYSTFKSFENEMADYL